jgi:hypothetical protein
MSLLRKLLKITIDVGTFPVSMVLDLITLGGVLTEENTSYTIDHAKAIGKDLSDIYNDITHI